MILEARPSPLISPAIAGSPSAGSLERQEAPSRGSRRPTSSSAPAWTRRSGGCARLASASLSL